MSFLSGKSKKTPPPTLAPTAKPTELDVEALEKDRAKRRALLAKAGRAGTILTEGQTLGSTSGQRSMLLGGGG